MALPFRFLPLLDLGKVTEDGTPHFVFVAPGLNPTQLLIFGKLE